MRVLSTLFVAVILSSCATNSRVDKLEAGIQKQISVIKYQIRTRSYLSAMDNCIMGLNYCLHKAKNKADRKKCSAINELCAINTYNAYKDLFDER